MTEIDASASPAVQGGVSEPAMQTLTIKLRLRDRHAAELNRQARAVNFVWNFANETSQRAWQRDHRWLSKFDLHRLTSGASKELDIHAHTIQRVCHQFVYSRDKAKRAGLRWRGKKSLGWVPFNTGHVTFDGAALRFRGSSYQPMHFSPRLTVGAKIGAGSFNQDGRGRWYINLPIQVECEERHPSDGVVGLDLGLKTLATLSDGGLIETPSFYRKSEVVLATAQRARKTRRATTIHAKVANRRKDFMHKASAKLAKEYGTIIVGDVSPSRLSQTRMAKSVLDAGWAILKRNLLYKAMTHGGRYLEVSEKLTTQVCSACGTLPASRPRGIADLGKRVWACDDCGTLHDRDVNAALNIRRVGLDTLRLGASL